MRRRTNGDRSNRVDLVHGRDMHIRISDPQRMSREKKTHNIIRKQNIKEAILNHITTYKRTDLIITTSSRLMIRDNSFNALSGGHNLRYENVALSISTNPFITNIAYGLYVWK